MKINLLKSLNTNSIITIVIYFIISLSLTYIFFFQWDNYSKIELLLNNFYSYIDIMLLINNNLKMFISWLIIYLIFLSFIKEKKWVIFAMKGNNFTQWEKLYSKYSHMIWFINSALSFVLPVYLYYLVNNSYFIDLLLLIIIFVLMIIVGSFLKKYIEISNDYDELYKINVNDTKISDKKMGLLFFFQLLDNFINSTLLFSFLIILVWYLYDIHLLTILYIHISFILIYIYLNIISNKFPLYITIKVDWKNKKWMLLEHSEKRVIFLQKSNRYLYAPNRIEHIKVLNKKKS